MCKIITVLFLDRSVVNLAEKSIPREQHLEGKIISEPQVAKRKGEDKGSSLRQLFGRGFCDLGVNVVKGIGEPFAYLRAASMFRMTWLGLL